MYKAYRSRRYEYATDAIDDIEERQCMTCIFSEPNLSVPAFMCSEAMINILLELPVEHMDESPNGLVVCNKYEETPNGTLDNDPRKPSVRDEPLF
jgi:hypothetical protein